MRNRFVILLLAMFFFTGCPAASTSPAPVAMTAEAKPAPPPPLGGLPVSVTVKQRSQTVIPGSAETLTLATGDITRGQVEATLSDDKLNVVMRTASMKPGDTQTFEFQGHRYELVLADLHNALVGEDFATLRISVAKSLAVVIPVAALTESQKIDRLIAAVESLEGATFVRNGTGHSPKEAAKHLREKRDYAGAQLKTADQFIEEIASKSSLSGDEYEIRFPDGRVVKAGEFLKEELKKLSIEM